MNNQDKFNEALKSIATTKPVKNNIKSNEKQDKEQNNKKDNKKK